MAHSPGGEQPQHALHQRAPDTLASMRWCDPEVQDLSLIGGALCHDVPDHAAA